MNLGMGADEQLGGYTSHIHAFRHGDHNGLVSEVKRQIARIGLRNLGRDDRVSSAHGIESRFPFLDEQLVSFLNQLPLSQKMNLILPRGQGDKIILRKAAEKAGLKLAAWLEKRAVQFGSRIAKVERDEVKVKVKGHHASPGLLD